MPFHYFMADFPLSKLYTNALISTLNARFWREDIAKVHATNVLFEQTTTATELHSFSVHQRQSAFMSSRGTGSDSYLRNSKVILDRAPMP
ncbi:hypothetical protein B0H16DRAFT_1897339 [Mycena metata]|uniref:Uncharacterized protein n=1 Tax=Mycena metata TaxID=1033252 RepID=A0AAD7HFJ7_9AGAR|nr:hypothetical protein B0H16DRAFT_1897339 [Mycena metata]